MFMLLTTGAFLEILFGSLDQLIYFFSVLSTFILSFLLMKKFLDLSILHRVRECINIQWLQKFAVEK